MDTIMVKILDGPLLGEELTSVRGGKYFSFKGIPYAKPPIGELRFQAPEPPESWNYIRPALKHGPHAPAFSMVANEFEESSNEDCLYLNVYTTKLPQSNMIDDIDDINSDPEPRPVMFWIHGGGFVSGSGDMDFYGPDYLITEDVVLVTTNYRLGPLGFLSLQNDLCPGNNGLKDIVMALRWVQANIDVFGGDPDNVTIFGESAGGACVNYLTISPLARGLFHKAISMSGSALCPWARSSYPRECAFKLGELLGLETEDDEELYNFLMKIPAKDLFMKAALVQQALEPRSVYFAHVPFRPVIEPDLPGAIITEHPKDIMKEGGFADVPYLLGTCSMEALIVYMDPETPKKLRNDDQLSNLLCFGLNLPLDTKLPKTFMDDIKQYYFPNGFDKMNFMKLISFVFYGRPISHTVEYLRATADRESPSYTLLFSRDGEKNLTKSIIKEISLMPGACHGDELGYLFHAHGINAKLDPDSEDYTVVEEMTKMWTDFAKTGSILTRRESNALQEEDSPYIDIETNIQIKYGFFNEERALWDSYESLSKD